MIGWHEQDQLAWSDFKGSVKNWGTVSALTASAIEYAYECEDGKLKITVKAIFIPEESWAKSEAQNQYILAHEQLHFDITEIHARKLRKELASKVSSCYDMRKIEGIAKNVIEAWKLEQTRYDKDTGHSTRREVQEQWSEKVRQELESYSAYTLENWKDKF